MVAFQNDTQSIESKIGPIRSHDDLKAAILAGNVASITPAGSWLVAWFKRDASEIEALEFVPIDCCKERWPDASQICEADTVITIEVHSHGPYIMVHPTSENAS